MHKISLSIIATSLLSVSALAAPSGSVGPYAYGVWQSNAQGASGPGQCDRYRPSQKYGATEQIIYLHGTADDGFGSPNPEFVSLKDAMWAQYLPDGIRVTFRRASDREVVFVNADVYDSGKVASHWPSADYALRAHSGQGASRADGRSMTTMYRCDLEVVVGGDSCRRPPGTPRPHRAGKAWA